MENSETKITKNSFSFNKFWGIYGTFAILLLLVIGIGILSPKIFLSPKNLMQVVLQSCIIILIACGEFFAILIAGIDLSVGSIIGLTGMISGKLMIMGVHFLPAILIGGVLCGGLLGCINGVLINKTGLHPFIVTLGTQAIFRGATLIASSARPIYGFPPEFKNCIGGKISFIPVPVIITFIYAFIIAWMLKKTIAGRNLYAIGGNVESAWFAGININLHRLLVFTICGISAGIAGVVMNARLGSAEPLAGVGYETQAIAAVIIGGASFFGGKGKIFGVVMGGLIIGVINNGLNVLQIESYYQQVVMGSLIICAVAIDRLVSQQK